MSDFTLIVKNLFRKPLRTILLIISIMIAFLLYGALNGFLDSFNRTSESGGANDRLIVSNKINFTQPLPYSYESRIRNVEGVADLTWFNWFGGYYKEQRNQIFTFAVDPESYLRIYKDLIVLPDDQARAFLADRAGIIVGKSVADRYGIKVGDRLPLFSNIFPTKSGSKAWSFNVRGIYVGGKESDPTSGAFLHWEYFDTGKSFGGSNIGSLAVVPADPTRSAELGDRIDALFANSTDETDTQDEASFNKGFLKQLGDLVSIVRAVVGAAFFAILMIVGNTLFMAVRERTKEIGVMKTLGFPSGRILFQVLAESLFISLLGAALGLGLGFVLLNNVLTPLVKDSFGAVSISLPILLTGGGLALALGLVTGLIPAIGAFRLRIIEALGRK